MADYWVKFNDVGVPTSFSGARFDGSELVQGVTDKQLCTMRRVGGEWVSREAEEEYVPTAEDIAREKEEAYQQALEEREQLVDATIMQSPDYRAFIRGEMTLTAYRDAASKIAASIPMPARP